MLDFHAAFIEMLTCSLQDDDSSPVVQFRRGGPIRSDFFHIALHTFSVIFLYQ